jgi:hypothetical protein
MQSRDHRATGLGGLETCRQTCEPRRMTIDEAMTWAQGAVDMAYSIKLAELTAELEARGVAAEEIESLREQSRAIWREDSARQLAKLKGELEGWLRGMLH